MRRSRDGRAQSPPPPFLPGKWEGIWLFPHRWLAKLGAEGAGPAAASQKNSQAPQADEGHQRGLHQIQRTSGPKRTWTIAILPVSWRLSDATKRRPATNWI